MTIDSPRDRSRPKSDRVRHRPRRRGQSSVPPIAIVGVSFAVVVAAGLLVMYLLRRPSPQPPAQPQVAQQPSRGDQRPGPVQPPPPQQAKRLPTTPRTAPTPSVEPPSQTPGTPVAGQQPTAKAPVVGDPASATPAIPPTVARSSAKGTGTAAPATPSAPAVNPPAQNLKPGWILMTFVRQSSQSGNKGYTPLEKLGSRHDAPSIVKKVRNWNYPAGRNGVAFGYLKIDEPGDYVFKTYGYYDRNSLVVGGKLVCPYRGSVRGGTDSGDPKQSKERIRLTAGLAPIAAIGFVDARGKMEVLWCPPGKSQFEAIPESRLLHDPQWMSLDTGADIQARLKAAAR